MSELDFAAIADAFAKDGFVRLGRLFSQDELAPLRSRVNELMLGQVVYPGMFFQHDAASGRYEDLTHGEGFVGPSLDYRKLEKLELDPLFRSHIENDRLHEVVRAFIDGPISIYRAVLFNKSARGGAPLPWHQDGGRFWGVDRDPFLQIWTALDDCGPAAGCLQAIPGSHLDGLATPLGGVVPKAMAESRAHEARLLPAEAGEVMLVHNYLWHRAGVNRSGRPRRTFSVCYMSAATRCLRRKRAPRAFVRVFEGAGGTEPRFGLKV